MISWLRLVAFLVPAALLAASALGATAGGDAWESWRTLRLQARSGMFFSARVEMDLSDEQGKTHLETTTTAKFMGMRLGRSKTISVIDPVTGRPHSYTSFSRKRARRYLFDETGYSAERLRPDGEQDADPGRWTVTSTKRFEYPTGEDDAPLIVFDYYGMLLHLKQLGLEAPGDEVTVYVATSRGPTPYRIRIGERRTQRRKYRNLSTGAKRSVEVEEFRLRVTPADPERADEGFLNMEGETELWVEAGSKTLLELNGKVPRVGRVNLTLNAIE